MTHQQSTSPSPEICKQQSDEYMMSSNDATLIEFTSNYNSVSIKFTCIDESVRGKISKLSQSDTQEQLNQLYLDTIKVYSYASEYDYSPEVPFNGFRAICKIIFAYFNKLSLDVKSLNYQIKYKRKKRLIDTVNQLVDYLPLLVHQVHAVKLISQMKSLRERAVECGQEAADATLPLELQVIQHLMKLTADDMIAFYSQVESFWLPESLAKFLRFQNRILICLSEYPLHIGIQGILRDSKYAKLAANQAVNWTPVHLANESKFIHKFSKSPVKSIYSVKKYQLSERQSKWIIDKDQSSVLENALGEKSAYKLPPVRLHILKPRVRLTDSVIIQLHGGGWSMGSPQMYYGIMCGWIKEMGATIVSIDYSLAPAHKYPIALQEILDTYLWLSDASASGQVVEPLGFAPQDIVVTGDSAGGNLSLALTIMLAEIAKKAADPPKLPKALDLMYPAMSPGIPVITASSVLLDTMLMVSKRLQFGPVYCLDSVCEDEKSYLCRSESPWFKNEDQLKSVYTKVNGNKSKDPLFHVFTYKSFDLLKDVKLYIQAAEFDPLCDDSILIAKTWRGPVQLDIMPDVVHGFNFLAEQSKECKRATELTNQRLKEALFGPTDKVQS